MPIERVAMVGTGAIAYAVTFNNCGGSVPVGGTCAFDVTFTPPSVNSFNARVRLESTSGVARTSSLTGTGVH